MIRHDAPATRIPFCSLRSGREVAVTVCFAVMISASPMPGATMSTMLPPDHRPSRVGLDAFIRWKRSLTPNESVYFPA
jgi:hypothetical protein